MFAIVPHRTARLHRVLSRSILATALMLAISLGLAGTVFAQTDRQSSANRLNALKQRDSELEAARAEQKRAADTEATLKQELATIGDDRKKLNQALIDTAARLRGLEGRIAGTEIRVMLLSKDEQKMRDTLASRRAVMVEVLAAMQRIGRHPPPAVIVSADDALATVRTAIMLGAVMPEMRGQAEKLAADLAALVRVRKAIDDEHERLRADACGARRRAPAHGAPDR